METSDSHLSERDKRIKRLLANTSAPDSTSVVEAMRTLEAEVRQELDPDQWGAKYNPFEKFPIKLAKLSKEDVMVKLRGCIQKEMMPSSTVPDRIQSKPQYLEEYMFGVFRTYDDEKFPDFPAVRYIESFGTVCLGKLKVKDNIYYAYYAAGEVEFLTRLNDERTLVRISHGKDSAWYDWDADENKGKDVAVNPYDLNECLEIYM